MYSGDNDRSGSLYSSLSKLATTLLSFLMTRRVQSISLTGAHTSRDSSNLYLILQSTIISGMVH